MAGILQGQAAKAAKARSAAASAAASGKAGAEGDAGAAAAAAELDILHPDRQIRLRDRLLTLREYGYIEGLQLQGGIKPLLDELYALFSRDAPPPRVDEVRDDVFAKHALSLQWLLAQSMTPYPDEPAGLEQFASEVAANAKFVNSLDDIEGDQLFSVWWAVNGGFFIRRYRARLLAEVVASHVRSASSSSTPP